METSKSGTRLCPHCGKPTPLAAAMCPDCGATLPPLPEITNKPLGEPGMGGTGIISFPLTVYMLSAGMGTLYSRLTFLPDLVMMALPVLSLIVVFAILFGIAYAIKQKRHYLGNAMQKTLFAWLILIGLLSLGLLLMCGMYGA